MARPFIDNTQQPPPGPHLRYVQVYSTTLVKWLRRSGGSWVTYGSPFTILATFETGEIGRNVVVMWDRHAQNWFPVTPGTGEKYRLIRGMAYNAVNASDATFHIDNIVLLAGTLDPRATPGNMAEVFEVVNSQHEAFYDNEYVVAEYFDTGSVQGWQTVPLERFRAIRGNYYSTVSSDEITIKITGLLDSGIDPRSDPTDADYQLHVKILNGDTFSSGDIVWADFNVAQNRWEARPKVKPQVLEKKYVCSLAGSVSAGTTSGATVASGATIHQVNDDGTYTTVSGKVYNPFTLSITPFTGGGAIELFTCSKFYDHNPATETAADDKFLLSGQEPRQRLASLDGFGVNKLLYSDGTDASNIKWAGSCITVVDTVGCVDGEVTGTTTSFLAIACTPE